MTGCSEARESHDLAGLATEPLSADTQEAARKQVEPYKPGDCSEAGLRVATEILASANAAAPTSPQARAVQALMAERIIRYNCEPTPPSLKASPQLREQVSILFEQANERLNADSTDLTTAIVWAKTGVALDRRSEINATILRAGNDKHLRDLLRKDDPTRDRLYSYVTSESEDRSFGSPLYRGRDIQAHEFTDSILMIVILPVMLILYVLGADWCC